MGDIKMNGIYSTNQYHDLDGNPVKRTPLTHRYSYDLFVEFQAGTQADLTGSVYSDRLLQWDYKLTRKLMEKHFGESGDYYTDRPPDKIQAFLRERLELPGLELIAVMQGCNVGNGYPVWWFGYREVNK